jgi:hypothetical protein
MYRGTSGRSTVVLPAAPQTPLLDNPPPAEKIVAPDRGTVLPMGDIGGRPETPLSKES